MGARPRRLALAGRLSRLETKWRWLRAVMVVKCRVHFLAAHIHGELGLRRIRRIIDNDRTILSFALADSLKRPDPMHARAR